LWSTKALWNKNTYSGNSDLIRDRLQQMPGNFRQLEIICSFENSSQTLKGIFLKKPDLAIINNKMSGLSSHEVSKGIRKETQ
jgi:DNA-binding NarL/FixJ family response regulator